MCNRFVRKHGEDMSKPVAYGMLTFCKNCGEQNPYTVKELTDEEILSVFVENYGDDILPNIQASGLEFARAILRKAQEK